MYIPLDELNVLLNNGLSVYEHYYEKHTGRPFGTLNTKMISPFPRNGELEKDPSFSVFLHSSKRTFFFKDHGIDKVGTHWQFVMDLFGIDFREALELVKKEVLNISGNSMQISVAPTKLNYVKLNKVSTRAEIIPVFREWTQNDLDYFKKPGHPGTSQSTLDIFKVFPVSHFDIKKENKTFFIKCPENMPGYAFTFESGHVKICQPKAPPEYKWTSNLSADEDFFGFHLVPKQCDDLFIIGGNRDCTNFYENIGYPVFALPSESANIDPLMLSIIKRIAKRTWIFYDNDPQGYRKAAKFKEEHGFESVNHLLQPYEVKDFTQLLEEKPDKLNEFAIFLDNYIKK